MACWSGESANGMTRARVGALSAMPSRRLAVALFFLAIFHSMRRGDWNA